EAAQRLATLHRLADPVLEHHVRREVAELHMARGSIEECTFGHEPDDLAPRRAHTLRGRLHLHHVEGAKQGRLLGVHEVHQYKRLPIHLEAQRLDVAQSAGGVAHRLRDVLRYLEIRGGTEVDVVGDEKGARSDGDGARGRMNASGAKVGDAIRIGTNLIAQTLELTTAHVGEVLAIGTRRRPLVEKHRDLERAPDASAEGASEYDAILHGCSFQWNERNDVGGAHARVLARVLRQVDQLARLRDAGERRVHRPFDGDDEGDDGAIVREIGGHIEHDDAIYGSDGVANGGDYFRTAAFRKIGNAFH